MPARGKKKGGPGGRDSELERTALEHALKLAHSLLDEYEQAVLRGDQGCSSAIIYERTGRSREKRFTKLQEQTGLCPGNALQFLARAQKKIRAAACQVRVKRDALQGIGKAPPELLLSCRQLNLRTQELGALRRLRLSTLTLRPEGIEDDEVSLQSTQGCEEEEEAEEPQKNRQQKATVEAESAAPYGVNKFLRSPCPEASTLAPGLASAPAPGPKASGDQQPELFLSRRARPTPPSKWMMYGPPLTASDEAAPCDSAVALRPIPPPPAERPPEPPSAMHERPLQSERGDETSLCDVRQKPALVATGFETDAAPVEHDSHAFWELPSMRNTPGACHSTYSLGFSRLPSMPLPPGLHIGWSAQCDELVVSETVLDHGSAFAYEIVDHFWGDEVGSLRLVEAGERLLLLNSATHPTKAFVARARTGARGTVPWALLRPLSEENDSHAQPWVEGALVTLTYDWHRPPWELILSTPAILRAGTTLMLREGVGVAQTAALVQPFPHEGLPFFVRVAFLRLLEEGGRC